MRWIKFNHLRTFFRKARRFYGDVLRNSLFFAAVFRETCACILCLQA